MYRLIQYSVLKLILKTLHSSAVWSESELEKTVRVTQSSFSKLHSFARCGGLTKSVAWNHVHCNTVVNEYANPQALHGKPRFCMVRVCIFELPVINRFSDGILSSLWAHMIFTQKWLIIVGGKKATTLDNVYNTVVCSVKILHLLTSPFTAGHYGGSYELLDDESSSSAEDEEGGQLVIDDSFNQYRKKNKKSKKSKKKKDKEKERRHSSKCMKKNTTAIAAYVYIFYSDRNTWCFLRLRCL